MENTNPISMKTLGEEKMKSKSMTILYTVLITVMIFIAVEFAVDKIKEQSAVQPNTPTITLEDVIIAYAPETKSIIFLDRKTGKVEITLSDSVSLAVFALKSGEIVSDYSSKINK